MVKTLRKNLARTVAVLTLMLLPMAVPAIAHADASTTVSNGVGCGTEFNFNATSTAKGCGAANSGSENGVQSILKEAVNIFSLVVGIVAVVMIIVGGFKYITSGGESSKVSGAQSTILYAIVGLVVVVLAQLIVHFVLNKAATANTAGSASVYLLKLTGL
jgi:cytochrome bd-type quinol oxidase subunit 2